MREHSKVSEARRAHLTPWQSDAGRDWDGHPRLPAQHSNRREGADRRGALQTPMPTRTHTERPADTSPPRCMYTHVSESHTHSPPHPAHTHSCRQRTQGILQSRGPATLRAAGLGGAGATWGARGLGQGRGHHRGCQGRRRGHPKEAQGPGQQGGGGWFHCNKEKRNPPPPHPTPHPHRHTRTTQGLRATHKDVRVQLLRWRWGKGKGSRLGTPTQETETKHAKVRSNSRTPNPKRGIPPPPNKQASTHQGHRSRSET